MARKDRKAPEGDRLRALLDAGQHRSARAEARARLQLAPGDAEARAVLASLAPEPGAVIAGALGVAAAVAIAAWTLLAG
jgi:hypothetical protein